MQRFLSWLGRLTVELRRRRVYQVVVLYAVVGFVVLQVADLTFEPLGIPERAFRVLVVLAAAGFPPAVALGWTFDLTTRGIERTRRGEGGRLGRHASIVRYTLVLGVALLSIGMGWGVWTTLLPPDSAGDSASAAFAEPVPFSPEDADPRRIAVLYLDDHSEDASLGYLAAGLTEALIHELGQVEGLHVVSRNGVKPFRHAEASIDSIVRATRAGSIVEGSVTRSGDRVRVTVQLIDGRSASHLDSDVLEHRLDDLFALQDSLATHVARSLRRRLGEEIRLRSARAGTESVDAWIAYHRGQVEVETALRFWQADMAAAERLLLAADSLFREARRADPTWVEPLVQRGHVAMLLARIHGPLPSVFDTVWAGRAEALLSEAIELDPTSAEAYERRGELHLRSRTAGSGRLAAAEEDLRKAVRLDPERPGAWWALSEVLVYRTRFSEAVASAERALRADAFLEVEASAIHLLYYSMLQLGPRDEAIRWCREGGRRFPTDPDFITCELWILGTFPQVAPDVERAWALRDSLLAAVVTQERDAFRPFALVWVAKVIARAGLADSARAVLRRATGEETPAPLAYDEAHVQLMLGNRQTAVELLQSYLTYDPDTAYLREDWWFEELRDYLPFRRLVGLPGDR